MGRVGQGEFEGSVKLSVAQRGIIIYPDDPQRRDIFIGNDEIDAHLKPAVDIVVLRLS
jgi:hypothetical protein